MRELGLGALLATVVFLVYVGVNVLPVMLFAGLAFLLYMRTNGLSGRSPARLVSTSSSALSFSDIGGQTTAKQELREALDFIKNDAGARAMGIRPLRGILLCGPPGTGKTLLARAAASYTDAAFLSVAGSEFIEMYAGVGAQRVRELFSKAEKLAKQEGKERAIIFIDEIDVLGAKRGQSSSHMEYDQTLNQLLVEMDGLNSGQQGHILLIGATNRPDLLDPALTRPGRFDRIVRVDLPDREARLQILKLHTRHKPLQADVNLEKLAVDTVGFSGAHLESLANEAAILAWRSGLKQITARHFEDSIDKVMIGEQHDRKPDREELTRVAIHESGHALVAELVRPGSVGNISILSRGGALGYVRHTPEQDRYLETEDYLSGQLIIMLAGGIAERLVLGNRSTGTRGDFGQAIEVCFRMISAGMSPLGVVDDRLVPKDVLYQTVQEMLQQAERQGEHILSRRIERIRRITYYLLDKEKLTGEEFRQLAAG
jgi:vesicle-fusing ATPase